MATKVYMEALSPTMEEGRLASWLKNEGEEVKEGDVLAEVETDKATMELVARGSGVLRKRLLGEGDTTAVGTIIAVIASADEDIGGLVGGDATSAAGGQETGSTASGQTEQHQAAKTAVPATVAGEAPTPTPDRKTQAAAPEGQPSIVAPGAEAGAEAQGGDGRIKASPLARRLAAEAGVALADLQGSGPGGRVVKRDIEAAVQGGGARAAALAAPEAAPQPAAAAPAEAPVAVPAPTAAAAYTDVPLSQMRKTIAKRLTQSIGPVPHFFLTIEADMGELQVLRQKINARFAEQGVKVSVNDMLIKAVALALTKHPWVNAAWTGEVIRQYHDVHVGVAVAVDEGLITPVVRDAHKKGVTEIAREVRELAGRAREKKLKPEEYTGSTFSISNLGMFGIDEFTAVINPPEAAILAVGGIVEKPVVENGEVVVRPRLRLTLSCDHRVVDGATGAQFLQTLKAYLEEPMLMIA